MQEREFGTEDFEEVFRETLYQGFFRMSRVTVRHRLFGGGWSGNVVRELFERGEAVGVLPYDPVNHLVGLVQQFRVGAMEDANNPWQYEVVAGVMESDESRLEVATRELQEEAGLQVSELVPIYSYMVSSGGTNEKIHLYCGIADLPGREGIFGLPEEDEDIRFHVWPYQKAIDALQAGRLNNAPVTIAMQWLQLNWQKLRDSSPE